MTSEKFRNKIRNRSLAITFNDVILLPGWTRIEPDEADLTTSIGEKIKLNLPFISSPMDTVTENEMAISLAREGGIGIIHRNCSIDCQIEMVKKVKRAESFIITDVKTISKKDKISDALEIMQTYGINGLPVITEDRKLAGILTGRDVRFAELNGKVEDVMTKDVIYAYEDITEDEAKKILHQNRIEKLPVVNDNKEIIGLITYKDLMLKGKFPNSSRDEEGKLLCGAAISPTDLARAKALDKEVDLLVTDVSHFHNKNLFDATKKLLTEISTPLVVGNIGTYEAAIDCLTKLESIIGLRCGIGSGSICNTGVVTRAGSPTLYATAAASDAVIEVGAKIAVIADGGVKNPGDIALALSVGASAVMMGNIFAGTKESPGRLISIQGRYYKTYWGMGSEAARQKRYSLDRYSQPSKNIAEGVEGYVPFKGTVKDMVEELTGGLKASMGYVGAATIHEMWEKAKLAGVSVVGAKEIRPHDIFLPGGSEQKIE
ncbi:MAG: IMP dehydrogenase [Candidatus Helarchaeota archaeon]